MTPSVAEIKALFAEVCDLPPAQRRQKLEQAGAAPEVIAEVEALCAAEVHTDSIARPLQAGLAADEPLASGSVLGAWRVEECIGEGGMGQVYRAHRSDGHFQQTAAIKLLAGRASAGALRHLARERQILARLVHPNIARLLDGGSTPDGCPYLVMEFVDGRNILEWCRARGLGPTAIIDLLGPICDAVAYAHRNLVVHCDLKPSNILVNSEGRPILLDFGVSRLLGETAAEGLKAPTAGSAVRTSAGYTPRYASPEQRDGKAFGTTTDIYSLGVTLAELLGVEPHALSENLRRLPPDLAAIIAKATATGPAQRYDSAEALAADLRRYQRRLPVQARTPQWSYLARRWLQRHWPWALAGAAFLATVVGFSLRLISERDAALLARNEAVRAGQTATAVKDYMVAVFQGADPEVTGRRDLPLSEVLGAGLTQLDQRLQQEPAANAELRGILAGVYFTIGRRAEAAQLYADAVELERPLHRPRQLATLLQRLAYVRYDMEDFAGAEPIAREALTLRLAERPESPGLVETRRLLGVILTYLSRTDEALAELQAAQELATRHFGDDSDEMARVHSDFLRYHVYTGDDPEAGVTHARRAQEITEKLFGREHYRYEDAVESVVFGLSDAGRSAEALPLAHWLSQARIARYGEISNQVGYALFAEATILDRLGQKLAALEILGRCRAIQEQLDGVRSWSSLPILSAQVRVQLGVGDLAGAEQSAKEVLEIASAKGAEDNFWVRKARLYLGQVLRLQGRLAEADLVSAAVLEEVRKFDSGAALGRVLLEMANLRRQQGRDAEARAILDQIDRAGSGLESGDQRELLIVEGELARADGDTEAALKSFLEAEALATAKLPEEHPNRWLVRLPRAELLAAQGKAVEAAALAREIRARSAPAISPGGWLDLRLQRLEN